MFNRLVPDAIVWVHGGDIVPRLPLGKKWCFPGEIHRLESKTPWPLSWLLDHRIVSYIKALEPASA